jgi:hypothetical protein
VRWLCDVRGLGRDRLSDLDADAPLRLAHPAAYARIDDRRDVRRGDLLDDRLQWRNPADHPRSLIRWNGSHRSSSSLTARFVG